MIQSFVISKETSNKIAQIAIKTDRSKSSIVRIALQKYFGDDLE
jgi:predicted transcriptional regulator